MLPSYYYITLH